MKNVKKVLLMLMMVAVAVASIAMSSSSSEAASKKVKLSKTKVTISVGEKTTIKLKNNSSKVKWSVSSKKVKITSKSKKKVTIKAVKAGTVTLKAKVGKKTYKCKIIVTKEATEKNISYTLYKSGDTNKYVGIFKNNNSSTVSIDPQLTYYDSDGNIIGTSYDFCYCLGAGRTVVLIFNFPYDSDYNYIEPASYKINLNFKSSSYYTDYASKISVTSNQNGDYVYADVTNNSGLKLDTICLGIIMYDASGNVIGGDYAYADCEEAGSTYTIKFSDWDSNYNYVIPASYEIYVKHAYQY